jgi:hypothetical protein
MDRDRSPLPVPLLASLVVTLLGMFVSVMVALLEEEMRQINESILRYTHSMLCPEEEWDRFRAYNCIMEDDLGPIPRFNQDSFKRIFCVLQKNYDQIKQLVPYSPKTDCFCSTINLVVNIKHKLLPNNFFNFICQPFILFWTKVYEWTKIFVFIPNFLTKQALDFH